MRNKGTVQAILCGIVAWCVLAATARVSAEEQVQKFLEELRRRQMFDVAVEYLDRLRDSRLVSDDVKQTILYEQGLTLVAEAQTLRDFNRRETQLELAREKFEQFIKNNPGHPLAGLASVQLGNVLVERGRAKIESSKRPTKAQMKDELVAEGRQLLDQAQKVFTDAETRFDEELKTFKANIDPDDRETIAARDAARDSLVRAHLLTATVLYEQSKTYAPGSKENKDLLEQSAAKYEKVYEDYRRLMAGLYARMWQARCYQELGDLKRALLYLEEVLAQPDDPQEFRELKRKALRLALLCWMDEEQKKYDVVIDRATGWLQQARGNEDLTAEGLAIRWLLAQTYELRAKQLEAEAENKAQSERDLRNAVKEATEVARQPGDHQQEAKALVARLKNVDADTEPATFAEAFDRAQKERDAMQVAENRITLARQTDKDKEKIPELEAERDAARDAALKYFLMAIDLREAETPIEDVNVIRYNVCYILYQTGKYYDAAVLGEFLARNYPESTGGRAAAKIAMAAYLKEYNESPPKERQFDIDRMVGIASYIGERWAGAEEADDAWMLLGDLANRSGDVAQAADYFSRIPESSPKYNEAVLNRGRALWNAYLKATRMPQEQRLPQADLDKLVADAQTTLQAGIERMRKESGAGADPSYTLISAELSLAQIYLDSSQSEKAVALLERPEAGVLALVEAGAPVVQRGNFPVETYKAALRGYVATQQSDKAKATMAALEKHFSSDPGSEAALTQIYVSLGRDLKEQVERLEAEGKKEELDKVTENFESFLDGIAGQTQGNTFNSLNWVADSFFSLGEGLSAKDQKSAKGRDYFAKAANTYNTLLKKIEDGSIEAQPASKTAIQIRVARCLRGAGDYKAARDTLVNVLAASEVKLEAQIEAAYAFQEWGTENPVYYRPAIVGKDVNLPGGKKVKIWGWRNLAARLGRYPKFRAYYHEALYNQAVCFFRYALTKDEAQRKKYLESAEKTILSTARLDPEMGGEEQYASYEGLLANVQRAMKKKPTPLSEVIAGLK